MSYSIDKMRAVSLQAVGGAWCMDVEELVRINRNTFRPRRRRLAGREAILQHLDVSQASLVAATRLIIDSEDPDKAGGRYEARGGRWVWLPHMDEAPKAEHLDGEATDVDTLFELARLSQRVDEMSEMIKLLSAEVSRLRQRGAASEAEVSDQLLQSTGDPVLEDEASVEERSEHQEAEATQDETPQPCEAQDEQSEVGEKINEAPPDFSPLHVPTMSALLDLVRGLVDETVNLSKADVHAWNLDGETSSYAAVLHGDDGTVRGALVMDLDATVRVAGGMLQEPEEVLASQIEERTPSDDILDAAGEVLNTLTSAVNKTSGNAHVRCGPLELLGADDHVWFSKCRAREDFSLSIGGRFAVLGR